MLFWVDVQKLSIFSTTDLGFVWMVREMRLWVSDKARWLSIKRERRRDCCREESWARGAGDCVQESGEEDGK